VVSGLSSKCQSLHFRGVRVRSAFHPIATGQQTSQFFQASDGPPLVRQGFKRLDVSARLAAVGAYPIGGEGKTVEADETFIGGRDLDGTPDDKTVVLGIVERGGDVLGRLRMRP
jgi:hypothetical protein